MAERMQHCFNCGEELGVFYLSPGEIEHCGKTECSREARDAMNAQREEAHEHLDRERGWDRW